MNRINNLLKLLNLSKQQIEILQFLISSPDTTVLEISRNTKIERTKVYRDVDILLKENLLTQRIDYKKKFYSICNTNILKDKVEEKINEAVVANKYLDQTLKQIERKSNTKLQTKVRYYNGEDGIKQVLWNQLKAKKEIMTYSYRDLIEIVGRKYFKLWKFEAEKKQLKIKDLRSIQFAKSTLKFKPIKVKNDIKRYIDPKMLDIITEIDIYNNTVAIFNWYKGDVFAVEIENEKFAKMQKQIFKTFWKLSGKYKRNKNII